MRDAVFDESLRAIRAAVDRFGAYRRRWHLLDGAGRFFLVGAGAWLAWFVLDWSVGLPPSLLVLGFALAAALTVVALAWHVGRRVWERSDTEREALVLERLHGRLDNAVIGSIQLGRQARDESMGGLSAQCVALLVRRTADTLASVNLRALLDIRKARRRIFAGSVLVAVMVLLPLVAPDATRARALRLRDAWTTLLETLFPISFEIRPGDKAVLAGTTLSLEVTVRGARRTTATLVLEGGDGKEHESWSRRIPLALSEGRGAYPLDVTEDVRYRVDYGARSSDTFTIRAGERPALEATQYEFTYPAYTGHPPRSLTGYMRKVQGLVGTRVGVSFAATTDLHAELCHVRWADGTIQPIAATGRFGYFAFTVGKPDRAEIHLTGAYGEGFEMETPARFVVEVQADQRPVVLIRAKETVLQMEAEQARSFGLQWEAKDDYGVSQVTLSGDVQSIDPLLGGGARRVEMEHRLDPSQTRTRGAFAKIFDSLTPPLQAGDKVTLRLSAYDNNTETGPGVGRSRSVEIVIVQGDLAQFKDGNPPAFGGLNMLVGIEQAHRVTDLLVQPEQATPAEDKMDVRKSRVDSQVDADAGGAGSEDDAAAYFNLLRGEP